MARKRVSHTKETAMSVETGKEERLDVSVLKRDVNLARFLAEPPKADYENIRNSIKETGQLQPAIVEHNPADGVYTLVAGFNRAKACEELGRPLWCHVYEVGTAEQTLLRAIQSNVHNEPTLIDTATNQQKLRELKWKGTQIASLYNMTPARVTQLKTLLTLPEEVKQAIALKKISGAAGLMLARIAGFNGVEKPAEKMVEIFKKSLVVVPDRKTEAGDVIEPGYDYYSVDIVRKACEKLEKESTPDATPPTPEGGTPPADPSGTPAATAPVDPNAPPPVAGETPAAAPVEKVKLNVGLVASAIKEAIDKFTLNPNVKKTLEIVHEYVDKKCTATEMHDKLTNIPV